MLRATLVALTLCAWCAAAEGKRPGTCATAHYPRVDLTELLRTDRVQSVVASYPVSKRLSESKVFGGRPRAPNDNCPTPTTCPQGLTGHYCDICTCAVSAHRPTDDPLAAICTAKNPQPPPPTSNAIEIRVYSTCSGTNYFPVDSTIQNTIYIFVDTTVPNSNPSITLYDPKGARTRYLPASAHGVSRQRCQPNESHSERYADTRDSISSG
jgi:hypothetical protein